MENLNVDHLIERLRRCEVIEQELVIKLCFKAREIFVEESNVQMVNSPVTVCGDIHGQFFDLREIFSKGGEIPETNYLFLGGYVNRGIHSLETFLLLLALKIRHPNRITLLRGSHEIKDVSKEYGFYDECLRKYGSGSVWLIITDIFKFLGITAIIDGNIFCVHGGLSPNIRTIDDILWVDRCQESSTGQAVDQVFDLLWSDPDENAQRWAHDPRRPGYLFGEDVVKEFLHENGIDKICRAHQLVMEGYKWQFGEKVLTLWSAPNYRLRYGNVGAFLKVNENLQLDFTVFEARGSLQAQRTYEPPMCYF